ncbi:hypothetical protein E6H36_11440 [Candidatus Bathyarchaeota archaeon]|nr:MAG: hypothetical protein E6H36_11440 [Candidatus Bathyarchaeota archaeon]
MPKEIGNLDRYPIRQPRISSLCPSFKRGTTMKVIKMISFVMCLLLAGLPEALGKDREIKYTGTFSNLEYNQEGGDLLGIEIKIVPTRKGYQGAIQIAEGGPSELMVVDVFFQGDRVKFQIPSSYKSYGGGVFEGTIDSHGMKGRLSFKGGTGDNETSIRRHSYWDTK